ncbi:MAG: ArsR/SmtB family transcription factor [Candidatus Asgardarchaeia archaeon]
MELHHRKKEKRIEDELIRLLETLGNETRIRILKSLSMEPMYVSEISNLLQVGQQAILRHLRELEEIGLIESYKGESIRGPDRKYYKIKDRLLIEISIQPDNFKIKLRKPVERVEDINLIELTDIIEKGKKVLIKERTDPKEVKEVLEFLRKNQSKLRFLLKRIDILIEKLSNKIREQ